MKLTRPLAGLLALGLIAAACGDDGDSDSASGGDTRGSALTGAPIVIGLDEDSTGPGASYSTIAGKTIRAAIDKLNSEDGILGRPVKLVVENDESDPTKTPSVVRKLVDQGAHALLMQTGGSAVAQAKSVVQQAQVIAIAPTSLTSTIVQPPDADYMYILANPISDFVTIFCGAWKQTGVKKLAVMADTSATIDGLNKLLLPGLKQCVEVVAEEKAPVDAADLSAQAARIKNANPDAILVTTIGGTFEVLAHNNFFQQMPKVPRFSLASIGNQPDSWKLAQPGALEGVIFMASIDMANENTKTLNEYLTKLRGKDFYLTAYDAQGWDAVMLIKAAIESAGGVDDKVKVRDAMDAITNYKAHFGQKGFTLSYNKTKHAGTNGLCGLVLGRFGSDNRPGPAWKDYQPSC